MTWAWRLRLAAVLAFRDARGSRASCTLVILSLALAVAGMHAMQQLSSQLSQHVRSNSRQWIAADAAVELDRPPSREDWAQVLAIAPNLRFTITSELPALARSDQAPDPLPVQIKIVDPDVYPFYGTLELKSGRTLKNCLNPGSAVVSPELLTQLQVQAGAVVHIGEANFRITDVIDVEPDRFAGPYTPAPRVILSNAGLDRTGLMRFSDAGFYHLLCRIPPSRKIGEICRRLEKIFPDSEVIDYTTPIPLVTVTEDCIVPFVSVASVLVLTFGAGAIAALSYLHLLQRLDMIAVLKSLGAQSKQLLAIFLLQIIGLAVIGSSLGIAGGWLFQRMGRNIMLRQTGIRLDIGVHFGAAMENLLLGVLAATVAASVSLWAVYSVRPAILLRRETGERDQLVRAISDRMRPGLGVVAGIVVPTVLVFFAADTQRTRIFVVASVTGLTCIAICIRYATILWFRVVRLAPVAVSFALRHGLANLQRYGRQTRGALLVMVGGVAMMLTGALGRHQISRLVIDSLPLGAPNLLLLNMDASDAAEMSATLRKQTGITEPPILVPTVPLALVRVDSAGLDAVRVSQLQDWIPRTWVATCSDTRPDAVHIQAGNWWTPQSPGHPIALEENVASLLRARVGSRIEFLVAGKPIETEVAAIVGVPPVQRFWYRVTLACGVLSDLTATRYSGGLTVEPSRLVEVRRVLQSKLHRATVADVAEVKRQAENYGADGVRVLAVTAALLGCIASALLAIAALALRPFRIHEIAILRALGASRRTLLSAFTAEYVSLGAIGALLGTPIGLLGANILLWYLTGKWTLVFDATSVLLAFSAPILLITAVGVTASLGLLRLPPLQVLRLR